MTAFLGARGVNVKLSGRTVLDDVSCAFAAGMLVAVVGANGAGKSTLAAVLLRFRDLSGGAALLNGHDLASYAADDVRSVIGGCPRNRLGNILYVAVRPTPAGVCLADQELQMIGSHALHPGTEAVPSVTRPINSG